MVRVYLPHHLRELAKVGQEVQVEAGTPVTLGSLLDALEGAYPMLKGTVRDHVTKNRRPYLRFFAAGADVSMFPWDQALPNSVAEGKEPFMIVGAVAGG